MGNWLTQVDLENGRSNGFSVWVSVYLKSCSKMCFFTLMNTFIRRNAESERNENEKEKKQTNTLFCMQIEDTVKVVVCF